MLIGETTGPEEGGSGGLGRTGLSRLSGLTFPCSNGEQVFYERRGLIR